METATLRDLFEVAPLEDKTVRIPSHIPESEVITPGTETGSHSVAQAGLELLGSSHPPASAS